jgi:hypothetical protein
LIIIALILTNPPVALSDAQAQAILTVEVLEVGINIEQFVALPSIVRENETTTFVVAVRNLGSYNLDVLPSSRIEIFKDGNLVKTLVGLSATIPPGSVTYFHIDWNVMGFPLGVYRVRLVIDWISAGFRSTATSWTTLEVIPLVPPAPPIIPPIPPVVYLLKVLSFPLLIEERAGETTLVSLEIVNESPEKLENATVTLEVAENWMMGSIKPLPQVISLAAGERGTINLLVSIPSTAAPGDYGFKLTVRSGEVFASTISILRVRPRLPDPHVSAIRHIYLDLENGETVVKIVAKNGSRFLRVLHVTDNVPPELAQILDRALFEEVPSEISPPTVTWMMESLQPFEERAILYRLPSILPDYQRYLYWRFVRLVATYEVAELLRIVDLKSEFLRPGGTGRLTLTLKNLSSENLVVTAILRLPIGWTVQPDGVSMKLEPAVSGAFVFYVTIPEYAEPMTYTGELRIYYKDQEMVRGVAFVVFPHGPNILLILIAVIVVAVACLVVVWAFRRRRWTSGRRPEVVEILRRAGEER